MTMNTAMAGRLALIASLAAGLLLCGCFSARVEAPELTVPTIGQQLMDLHRSYAQGHLTAREYQQYRQRIMESADEPRQTTQRTYTFRSP